MTTIKVRWDPHPPREMARHQKYLMAGHFDVRGQVSEIRPLISLRISILLFLPEPGVSLHRDLYSPRKTSPDGYSYLELGQPYCPAEPMTDILPTAIPDQSKAHDCFSPIAPR